MKIGLQILSFDWPGSPGNIGSKLAEIASTADELGYEISLIETIGREIIPTVAEF